MQKHNRKNYSLYVGVLVGFGTLLFVTAIFLLGKQQNLFGSTVTLKTVFPNVSGLLIGNNVRFNGINVGTVGDILLLSDTAVLVNMYIEKNKLPFIRTNSRCIIGTEGLMGDKVITITSGDERFPSAKDNHTLKSDPPVEIDNIMGNLQTTSENVEIISSELAMIFYKVNNGNGVLSMMLEDSSMATNFANTLKNLETSSESLDENLDAMKQSFILRGAYRKMKKDANAKAEDAKKDEKSRK
jgi:phospholipid/cholesterol/gamma-HCH transport system substrate-binding protein